MPPPRPMLRLEPLEPRDVPAVTASLSGTVLTVRGTAGIDRIILREANNRLHVADVSTSFATAALSRVDVDAGDGNDRVDVRSVTVPVTLSGLTGADQVTYDRGKPVRFADWGPDTVVNAVDAAADPLHPGVYPIYGMAAAGEGFVTWFSTGTAYFSRDGYDLAGGGTSFRAFLGGGSTSISKMVAAGGGVVTLFTNGSSYFSPDGRNLAGGGRTVEMYPTTTARITDIVPVAGGVLTVLNNSTTLTDSFSAYFSTDGSLGTVSYSAPSDGLRIKRVIPVHNGVVTLFTDGKASYSADGRSLRTAAGLATAYAGTQSALFAVPVAGGVVTRFTDGALYFSPDGKNLGSRQVFSPGSWDQIVRYRNGFLFYGSNDRLSFNTGAGFYSGTGAISQGNVFIRGGLSGLQIGDTAFAPEDYDVYVNTTSGWVTIPASSISSTINRIPELGTAPQVRKPNDLSVTVGEALTVPLEVFDAQGPLGLRVTATGDAAARAAGLRVVSNGKSGWSLALTPAAAGAASIQVMVSDGVGTAVTTFTVTAAPVPTPAPAPTPTARATAYGAFPGAGPVVSIVAADGTKVRDIPVYDPGFRGGVRTVTADLTGDGVADVVAGPGPGMVTLLRAFDGRTGALLWERLAFEEAYTAGVFLAVGELTGDGVPDVVVTPDQGGGPVVKLLRGDTGAEQGAFFGIDDPNFRGGARTAVGDVNGDGRLDLIVGAGFGGGPRVAVYDGRTLLAGGIPPKLFNDFFVFEQSVRDGVYLGAGDLDGDGFEEVVAGGGPGGGPRVRVLSGRRLMLGQSIDEVTVGDFFAFDPAARGGVLVTVGDANGDGRPDVFATPGTGGTTLAFDGRTRSRLDLAGAADAPAAITRPALTPVPAPDPALDPSALEPDYFRYRTFEGTFEATRTETWGLLNEPDRTENRRFTGTFRVTLKFNGAGVPTGLNVAAGWSVAAATATLRQVGSFPAEVMTPDLTGDNYRLDGVRLATDKPILLTGGLASLNLLDDTGGERRLVIVRFTFNTDAVTGEVLPWNNFTRSMYSSTVSGRFLSYGRPAEIPG